MSLCYASICPLVHVKNSFDMLMLMFMQFFRRPPLADDIGIKYTMLDPTFDKGHRARFIENGVVSNFLKPNISN